MKTQNTNIPRTKILIIESFRPTWDLYREILEYNEYHVTESEDFQTGFAIAKSVQPDLVLLGIMLPQVQGIELDREGIALLSELRHSIPYLPVIMVTSIRSEEVRKQCLKLGASGYFVKHGAPSELLKLIRSVLAASQIIVVTKIFDPNLGALKNNG